MTGILNTHDQTPDPDRCIVLTCAADIEPLPQQGEPMSIREYHRMVGLDPDAMEMLTRIRELECRVEDLATLLGNHLAKETS